MIHRTKKQSGYIALTTVLIVTTILVLGGVTLAISAVDYNISVEGSTTSVLMKNTNSACLEESLYRLKNNSAYTGTFTVALNSESCSGTVSNLTGYPLVRRVVITSTNETFTSTDTFNVDTANSNLVVTRVE